MNSESEDLRRFDVFRDTTMSPAKKHEIWSNIEATIQSSPKHSKPAKKPMRYMGSILAATVALLVVAIGAPFLRNQTEGRSSSLAGQQTSTSSAQMSIALTKAEKLFRDQHLVSSFASSFNPGTNAISIRMLVQGKISKTKSQELLNHFLQDIAQSYPNNRLPAQELLQGYNFHFEIVDTKDNIDPLFYGSKEANSTQIQWDTTPSKVPTLNVSQPVIPGTTVQVDGWVPKGIRGLLITTATSLQTCSVQDNGYFSTSVLIPNNLSQGTTQIQIWSSNHVILKKTISVANAYDPTYLIAAEHAIIQQKQVTIDQIHIFQVKTLSRQQWLVLYKIKNGGNWVPTTGKYGVQVIKQVSGQYTTQFAKY